MVTSISKSNKTLKNNKKRKNSGNSIRFHSLGSQKSTKTYLDTFTNSKNHIKLTLC